MDANHRYFIINKPVNMVSQFISSHNVRLLADLDFDFPEGIHAIGRLDNNSEGLLLLTTNKKITRLLFSSEVPHSRCYLVLVNNILSTESLEKLKAGVAIKVKDGNYYTASCNAEIIEHPEKLYKSALVKKELGVHSWLLISLTEGKFRQVRKMIAAIRHRCKRLIRISIEQLQIGDLEPGQVKEINEKEFFEKLKIKY